MSDEHKKKKSKLMLSEKESIDQLGNPIKASSELNFYTKKRPQHHDFERRRQHLSPRFCNPILPGNINLNRLNFPNRNLIPDLMRLQPSQEPQNYNMNHLQDIYRLGKGNKFGRHLEMIKSPKSEMNNVMRTKKNNAKGFQNGDFSALVSVNDYKDNISNQDALSRRIVKGNTSHKNVFYQNSSNNLPSNNISEQNLKSSILSFKDNQNDATNLSANVKPDDSMLVLQSLRFKGNHQGFFKQPPLPFNSHFPYGNEPSFQPIYDKQKPLEMNPLGNLQQMSFENQNQRNRNSPQITRGPAFRSIFPKKTIRPSITSNNEDLLMNNEVSSPPLMPSVDRETQIMPAYNYSAKHLNLPSNFGNNFLQNLTSLKKLSTKWDIQTVR